MLVLLLLAGCLLTRVGRVAALTLLLLPDLFVGFPLRPLTWISAEPSREEVHYEAGPYQATADLYRPAGAGPHGAMLFFLGVNPIDRRDPVLTRFVDGLSRCGVVVLVPESPLLLAGKIEPVEADALVAGMARRT